MSTLAELKELVKDYLCGEEQQEVADDAFSPLLFGLNGLEVRYVQAVAEEEIADRDDWTDRYSERARLNDENEELARKLSTAERKVRKLRQILRESTTIVVAD